MSFKGLPLLGIYTLVVGSPRSSIGLIYIGDHMKVCIMSTPYLPSPLKCGLFGDY